MSLNPSALARRFEDSWHDPAFETLEGKHLCYGDLWTTATWLSDSWKDADIVPGDIVAFRLENSWRIPCIYLACAIGGFVACPIVPSLKKSTMQENLADIKPALLIETLDLDVTYANDRTLQDTPADIDEMAPFLIMFSSGSTGKNKAICHCLKAVCGSASAFASLSGFNQQTRLYHALPMTYMAGFLNTMLAIFMCGGKIIEGPQFQMSAIADFWRHPLASDANVLSLIPPLAAAVCRLTRNQDTVRQVSQQFTQVQCTSASIQLDLRRRFLDKFELPLKDCYGMTELGGALTLQSDDDAKALANCSVPMPELDIRIDDHQCLYIRSPFRMLGYLVDGELLSPFDDDGFLDTGDLATFDNGKLEITGRVKDIIIRGGINTSPARIESAISQFEGVDEVSVVGIPHSFWGEEIIACVIGDAPTDKILEYCRQILDTHEQPNRIITMDAFPRSFIGKILKADLAAKVQEPGNSS